MRVWTQLSFALALLACAVGASAQTGRKAKPLATPPPLTGAEIISRAGVDQDEPPAVQPVEQPAAVDDPRIGQLNERIKKLESGQRSTYDEKQKRLLLNLDILTRAEQRTESLRKQAFDMIERENALRTRLDQIEFDIRPEMIERTTQLMGMTKPEEIRENRRKSLAAERTNLQSLMSEIQIARASINASLQKAEAMVDRLRAKLEKDIDDALLSEDIDK